MRALRLHAVTLLISTTSTVVGVLRDLLIRGVGSRVQLSSGPHGLAFGKRRSRNILSRY